MIESVVTRDGSTLRKGSNGVGAQSRYLQYLPSLYRDDELMGRLLLMFESILGPIENMVDVLPAYLDPRLVPEPLLPWLASWVDVVLDDSWSLERRRELVRKAGELYRWRGTRRGLSEYLRIYTGVVPLISEHIPGMRLDAETRLGADTRLGSSGAGHHFTVTVRLRDDEGVTLDTVRAIIDVEKPAHTAYTLQIGPA